MSKIIYGHNSISNKVLIEKKNRKKYWLVSSDNKNDNFSLNVSAGDDDGGDVVVVVVVLKTESVLTK